MYEFLRYLTEDVMAVDLVTIAPDATLRDAEDVFEAHGFNGLPVVAADGEMVGFLTQLDLLRAFRFDDDTMFPPYPSIARTPVAAVMTREFRSVRPRTPVFRVLEKLVKFRTKSLPVLDGDRLVGIISREDVVQALRKAGSGILPSRDEPVP
ncbi:MAG: CBS domain-containing protein [Proteobacteria bacterium]|nr:CBS domain-containing protein [Pseudomonadota bacterium]